MTILTRLGAVRAVDRAHAIARNLEAVLNTKQGYGGTLDHLGLTEHDIEGPASAPLERLAADIEGQIRAFEPRLTDVRVGGVTQDDPQWVRVVVEGVDRGVARRFVVRFDAMLRCAEVSVAAEVQR